MTRFLLGVAGAVLNPLRLLLGELFVPGRLDGAVRMVPSLLLRLPTFREDAIDRLRSVTGVDVDDPPLSSISLSPGSMSRLARTSALSGFMLRKTSANSLIRSRNSGSLRGRAEK